MKTHPFEPVVFSNSKALLIGSLPPESAPYYFSNSTKTRLWDILRAIRDGSAHASKHSNHLSRQEKHGILEALNLGMCDIIYGYDRADMTSGKDQDIRPLSYRNIPALIEATCIDRLLFVYQSAARWFLHSLSGEAPVKSSRLTQALPYGVFRELEINGRTIGCELLPNPLNRGKKGETLDYKLRFYRERILR